MVTMYLTPERAALLDNQSDAISVLLRINANDIIRSTKERKPLNLSVVIDRSGSMSGQPIREAVRCANFIVDRMQPTDRLSIVSYDDSIKLEVPSQIIGDRTAFKRALSEIDSGGSTDLHGGWLSGAEQVAMHQTSSGVSRVLILSDGCANHGVTDPEKIAQHCATIADSGVHTSTYGLGSNFNEDLMSMMAKSGLGNAYYGQSAQDLIDPFTEEFDLLSALCARKLRLSLKTFAGGTVEVANRYSQDANGRFILPDLAIGGDVWALINLNFPTTLIEQGAKSILILTANLEFEDLEGNPSSTTVQLRLDSLPHTAYEQLPVDPTVRSRSQELRVAEIQDIARTAARRGDWGQVDSLLSELKSEIVDSPWLSASLSELERYAEQRETESFSKEAFYKTQKMRSRLSSIDEHVSYSLNEESIKPSFLRRKLEEGKRFDGNK